MAQILVKSDYCQNKFLSLELGSRALQILQHLGYPEGQVYITSNGRCVNLQEAVHDGGIYHIIPKVLGGKGGFGSMLRAIGAQIEKTTNREACRDLSGRRMRDVNNEKQLRDWVAKAADREREKEKKKRDRLERRRAEPMHKFEDPTYHEQTAKVAENLDDALQHGLAQAIKRPSTSGLSSRKRKAPEATSTRPKKARDWMGVDVENLSDLDSDSDPENAVEAHPGTPPPKDSGNPSPQSYQPESEDNSDSGVESVSVPTIKKCMETMDIDSASSSEGQKGYTPPRDSDCSSMEVSSAQEMDSDTPSCSAVAGGSALQPPLAAPVEQVTSTPAATPPAEASTSCSQIVAEPPTGDEPLSKAVTGEPDNSDIDLMSMHSVNDLEALGLDRLKAILMSRGLKCGGTLLQRVERLWAVRGLSQDQIDPSLLAGGKNKGKSKRK